MYEVIVMEEREKPGIGKWKYLFILDAIIIVFILGILVYFKALYI